MKVILNTNVENLGSVGDVVKVRDGYGRNFLIPNGAAVVATESNIKVVEREKAKEIAKERALRGEAEALAEKLRATPLQTEAEAGDEGKLFGSITLNDVHNLIKEAGFDLDKKSIRLPKPIRKTGVSDVEVRCYTNLKAIMKLTVVAKQSAKQKAAKPAKAKKEEVKEEEPAEEAKTEA